MRRILSPGLFGGLLVGLVIGFALARATSTQAPRSDWERAQVLSVIDGDTIVIEGGESVRYIGLDTPEVGNPPECYGPEATEANRFYVEGKEVLLLADVEDRDQYGRLLRYVFTEESFVNAELVRRGFAYSFSYGRNLRFQQLFVQLERFAREGGVGLWVNCLAP